MTNLVGRIGQSLQQKRKQLLNVSEHLRTNQDANKSQDLGILNISKRISDNYMSIFFTRKRFKIPQIYLSKETTRTDVKSNIDLIGALGGGGHSIHISHPNYTDKEIQN